MSNEKALETVAMFQEKLRSLLEMGPNSNWRVEWDICQNDIGEWIKGTFEEGSKDYQEIHRILHPTVLVLGRDDYQGFVYDAQRLQRSFALTEHRLKEGQAQPLQDTADELLIEPGTPHSAYVFLRDIVEAASRLVFLVDPYVDRTLFSLLSNVAAGVEIRILTRPQNVPADFVAEAGKFIQQSGVQLECRAGLADFHDRFLATDDRLFFSGASFKDLGKKGSVVGEIQDIKDQIVKRLEKMWQSASALK